MTEGNKTLFFETSKDKWKVFQTPELVMFSEKEIVERWKNTQSLYFYPFSWLDYLGKKIIRELYLRDCFLEIAEREIRYLDRGKVHFEKPNEHLMKLAKERGHKISVICNLEDLSQEEIRSLSLSDFVKIRVNRSYNNLYPLSNLPNERILSCVKVYMGEYCDYQTLALQAREIGFDFLHVFKRLIMGQENQRVLEEEKERILKLQELETKQFRIIIPSSLEERFAKRFAITYRLGNVSSCNFSKYRLVLQNDRFYPCYTQSILAQRGFKKKNSITSPDNCLDCACIYENDMLQDIENKMKNYKNTRFALEYIENGK